VKSSRGFLPVTALALAALVFAGCSKGSGGSSSGGSGSSSSDDSATGGGSSKSGKESLIIPPPDGTKPYLGTAYYYAALGYYYIYHKKDTVIWGDVGSLYGDYDNSDYSSTMDSGYAAGWPTFAEATIFGDEHYSYYGSTAYPSGDPTGYSTAISDTNDCYTDLASRTPTVTRTDRDLSGETLGPGVYLFNNTVADSFGHIHKDVTLNGGTLTLSGTATDTWIFRIPGNLFAPGKSKVVLTGGAQAKNVWWQVGVEHPTYYDDYRTTGPDLSPSGYTYDPFPGVSIGDDLSYPPWKDPAITGYANFIGTIICNGDIRIGPGSNLTGRALMINGTYYYSVMAFGSISINETAPVPLGSASDPLKPASYAALAFEDITSTGETLIKGSVGVSTGTKTSGGWTVEPPGIDYADTAPEPDAAIAAASANAVDALSRYLDYNSLMGSSLLGKKLPGGVYEIDGAALTGDPKLDGPITLDGRNDPASVWIFRISGPLDIYSALGTFQFKYLRGANADNVIWIADTVHVGPSTNFRGTLFATAATPTAIELDSDAVIQGRVIALNGSITMNANTIFSDSTGGLLSYPAVVSDPDTTKRDEARSVDNDTSNIYVFGFSGGFASGTDNSWRIEKRTQASPGSLVAGFGTSGVLTVNPGPGMDIPRRIIVDETGGFLYIFGSRETFLSSGVFQWRIEKRSLTTGALSVGVTTTIPTNGTAGDMALDGGFLYCAGEEADKYTSTLKHIRVEKRSASTLALVSGFNSPDTWIEPPDASGFPTTTPPDVLPPLGVPDRVAEYPATAGVVTDLSWDSIGGDTSTYGSRGANCITLMPSASPPSMLLGGYWKYGGGTFSKDTMFQKRYLSSGDLDIYVETPFNPGFGGSGDGTSHTAWSLTGGDDEIHSIATDGTDLFAFMTYRETFDLPYPYSLSAGYDYWAIQKREAVSGTLMSASMYLLGTYGPVPRSPDINDFGPNQLTLDVNRLFIASANLSSLVLPDLMWRIEKRKSTSLAYDSLFNTEGAQPGSIEVDPAFGVPGDPEHWTEIWGYEDMPGPAYGTIYYAPVGNEYHYTHYDAIPDIIGGPDRAWGIIEAGGKVFIVGMDSADPASHVGQWRIECRNK
jgi:hypothetical protein